MTTSPAPLPGAVLVASPNVLVRERIVSKIGAGPVHVASGGAEALARLESGSWQTLVLDRQIPDLNAEELMEMTARRHPGIRVMLVDSSQESAAEIGGFRGWIDAKPAGHIQNPAGTNIAVTNRDQPLPEMVGDSEAMREVYRMVRLVAARNTTVLITGPTGSGKELVARAIHRLSARAGNTFSVLNCAALPETLIESELFGFVRGAFTGAAQTYAGRILASQGGTLFLDEIGELPQNAQSKLLRFLEQKEVQRLGSAETTRVDVRVVAATNRDLADAVERGEFREDLFFRLSAFPVRLAPLAERQADIRKLAAHFLARLAEPGSQLRLDARVQQLLDEHSWPGNVRELQQLLVRAVILADGAQTILAEHLRFGSPKTKTAREGTN